MILLHEQHYERTASGKGWKSKPYQDEIKEINYNQYSFYIESVPFFKNLTRGTLGYERSEKSYTKQGYIITKITSVRPDQQEKIIRQFKFE